MPRKLPPLNALKAFEAAGRTASFTKAALELNVTQGAVSKQIKILEDFLGLELFERKDRIKLTPAGEIYLPVITSMLDRLEQATDGLKKDSGLLETLNIRIFPTLSNRWLIPLLEDFRKKHPNILIGISIGDAKLDFSSTGADIDIRSGKANSWKQYHAEKIMDEELLPVCSPKLKIKSIKDMKANQLIQHMARPNMWREYMDAIGEDGFVVKPALGFEHFFMLIQAAVDGMGVVLVPKFMVAHELKTKQLVPAVNKVFKSPYAYYFICPKHKADLKKVRVFYNWLKSRGYFAG